MSLHLRCEVPAEYVYKFFSAILIYLNSNLKLELAIE